MYTCKVWYYAQLYAVFECRSLQNGWHAIPIRVLRDALQLRRDILFCQDFEFPKQVNHVLVLICISCFFSRFCTVLCTIPLCPVSWNTHAELPLPRGCESFNSWLPLENLQSLLLGSLASLRNIVRDRARFTNFSVVPSWGLQGWGFMQHVCQAAYSKWAVKHSIPSGLRFEDQGLAHLCWTFCKRSRACSCQVDVVSFPVWYPEELQTL